MKLEFLSHQLLALHRDLWHGQLRSEEPNQRRQARDVRRGHGGATEGGVFAAGNGGVDAASLALGGRLYVQYAMYIYIYIYIVCIDS